MAPPAWQFAAISALGYFTTVSGHGFMCGPDPEFTTSGDKTAFITTIPSTVFPSFGPNEDAAKNADKFAQGMKEGGFPDLKTFLQPYGSECGDTNKYTSPRQIPSNGKMCWKNSDTEGLTASHHGPCEIWIDDQKMLNSDDCVRDFGSQSPTLFNVDYSKCVGNCNLQFYWVALQSADTAGFQVYKNCVPLAGQQFSGGGGGGTTSVYTSTPVADTPAPTEDTPAPSEQTPSPPENTPAPEDVTPAPSVDSPSPSENTPAPEDVTPVPSVDSPSPSENTPAPADTPAPVINTPMPSMDTPVPSDGTPSPSEGTPSPASETPTPADYIRTLPPKKPCTKKHPAYGRQHRRQHRRRRSHRNSSA